MCFYIALNARTLTCEKKEERAERAERCQEKMLNVLKGAADALTCMADAM